MSDYRTTGVIVAAYGSPGPASGITYDIDVNLPGVGIKRIAGVVPHCNRPPDDYDTLAATVGSVFDVAVVGDSHQYLIVEYPDSAECQP